MEARPRSFLVMMPTTNPRGSTTARWRNPRDWNMWWTLAATVRRLWGKVCLHHPQSFWGECRHIARAERRTVQCIWHKMLHTPAAAAAAADSSSSSSRQQQQLLQEPVRPASMPLTTATAATKQPSMINLPAASYTGLSSLADLQEDVMSEIRAVQTNMP